jgi:uncharacterized integral membrane protein (TIGR00698 family)
MSLILGIIFALIFKISNDRQKLIKKWSGYSLQISIVLLGASLNFHDTTQMGVQGVLITFFSISLIFIFGFLLNKIIPLEKKLQDLITSGTAICGGSAIGAIAPVIKADHLSMAISLGIVFLLNTVALFLFPLIGHLFELDQQQFGIWAALAIHDTSSVVAATQSYGEIALKIGTTLKLSRALWIIPLSLLYSYFYKNSEKKFTIPWFILFFVLNSLLFTFVSDIDFLISPLKLISKYGFYLTLFLIGLTLNLEMLKSIKKESLYFGIGLWIITSVISLIFVINFY